LEKGKKGTTAGLSENFGEIKPEKEDSKENSRGRPLPIIPQ